MLRPWQDSPDTSWLIWKVFGRQLQRWEDFRVWQLVNRDIYDPDSAYFAFVEKEKRMWVVEGETEKLAALEDSSHRRMRCFGRACHVQMVGPPYICHHGRPRLRVPLHGLALLLGVERLLVRVAAGLAHADIIHGRLPHYVDAGCALGPPNDALDRQYHGG
ncbi:hypothetical protein QBC35DRAFT_493286 [Podospora australis]|uniref:Uncharacterized protein n=1 Tax=Podospora australis TaxID=1536484 RepID=A0AAN7AL52_9PEZI|nr:hypothetical protein QBC35DRAFT_493286 [Podospora australis]